MVIYNPVGPNVVWSRTYNSFGTSIANGTVPEPNQDFGFGWSHPYDIAIYLPGTTMGIYTNYYLMMPNGAQIHFYLPTGAVSDQTGIVDNGNP